ncbi:50S ribosomal protein L19e [Sulfolobus acidocaldarius]|uniref:Large ribosomal subunit protein eL19 n=5 Tax=Sulfolobus acidocaldarius TaxID=2285 RepID=RL19E_SULAC|nr:50S ribosomal protein L19e [Sulfolobus acidocaldarius]O05639.1 RecName: Full=Large ribosomal subunit protein eL19; AltName: Full=50S ribosomal protein L19e [Sulfolobus acidocaldarius DSM 639]AAY79971.1 50S ribosomal protein L19E [Sulfolobus acidocaldarius DSM 639]AGE70540.1 50S ribosomal protein L19e [Sulfolobus acidocaldarius N8]AGE72813.1 50S ribosomal protein L19e [Sulfolobus acidocaldarius Ron12/I]ALU30552.1 50S ribosomal protein L19 [Sulfolobus acidocaldarius]ALU32815.1 50S ribosomal 
MPEFQLQRRLAADIAGVGLNNIKFNPERLEEVEEALTREDIKKLIKERAVIVNPKRGISSGRLKERKHKRRSKGEGRKHGSRKGKSGARTGDKEIWINKIRKIRRYIRWLRDNNVIDKHTYRLLYKRAKGNYFKNLSDVKSYLRQMGHKV